jgi:leucyl/phenylalanyl-tRNA--protein transferase
METTQENFQERPGDDGMPRWLEDSGELVAVGGQLDTPTLLAAYRQAIFPWYDDASPVLWWSPDPRAILELAALHVPRRLRRVLRSGRFRITRDRACEQVIRECAIRRREGTWLTGDMIRAYCKLHREGHVHSVEAWLEDRLVGGVYGIAAGAFFSGESMFHRVSDASNAALVSLVEHLRQRGFELFDLQVINDHTRRLGATEIPRAEYYRRLRSALRRAVEF